MKNILITGGAGFIGSHLVRHFVKRYPDYMIINVDLLTYAGDLENLADLAAVANYVFEQADIRNTQEMERIFLRYEISHVIHLAAESHVDRSISDPLDFVQTNVIGTVNLLEAARRHWASDLAEHLFYHVSTDEVYGSLGPDGLFTENTRYDPHSPYSASKAASDHFVRAYGDTYGIPVIVSNCSNNYGPNQHSEKLIPLLIGKIMDYQPLPVYGDGKNIRDWLNVKDHVSAIDLIFHRAKPFNTYNIGGSNEWSNIELVRFLCRKMDTILGRPQYMSEQFISFVTDRPGHDLRYAIDSGKLLRELGWRPSVSFNDGIGETIQCYITDREKKRKLHTGDRKLLNLLRNLTEKHGSI